MKYPAIQRTAGNIGNERRMWEKIIKRNDADDVEKFLWMMLCGNILSLFRIIRSILPPVCGFLTQSKRKNGEYSGELVIFCKAESKILTRNFVLLAFHKVVEEIRGVRIKDEEGIEKKIETEKEIIKPEYKGPKFIGQIFGISYVYSLFWR